MARLKQIIFFIAVAILINGICTLLQSTDFLKYLRENMLVLLITLLAINTATISVVVAKLHEIGNAHNVSFERTIKEVKVSLIEQIILIIAASAFMICYNSPIIRGKFSFHENFFNTMFIAVFIYAIDILRDTGVAVFDIIKHKS